MDALRRKVCDGGVDALSFACYHGLRGVEFGLETCQRYNLTECSICRTK